MTKNKQIANWDDFIKHCGRMNKTYTIIGVVAVGVWGYCVYRAGSFKTLQSLAIDLLEKNESTN